MELIPYVDHPWLYDGPDALLCRAHRLVAIFRVRAYEVKQPLFLTTRLVTSRLVLPSATETMLVYEVGRRAPFVDSHFDFVAQMETEPSIPSRRRKVREIDPKVRTQVFRLADRLMAVEQRSLTTAIELLAPRRDPRLLSAAETTMVAIRDDVEHAPLRDTTTDASSARAMLGAQAVARLRNAGAPAITLTDSRGVYVARPSTAQGGNATLYRALNAVSFGISFTVDNGVPYPMGRAPRPVLCPARVMGMRNEFRAQARRQAAVCGLGLVGRVGVTR
jgi:hypothetical protein